MTTVQPIETSVSKAMRWAGYCEQRAAQESQDYDDAFQQVKAGTHRFKIHPGQAIYLRPQGFFINRAEERKRRLEENAAAVEIWARRYAIRTPDGLEIRER